MSLELRLTCDCCSAEFDSEYTMKELSPSELAREAKREGWRRQRGDWFCDRCIKLADRFPNLQPKENAS